jgi:hypothetical protein
LQEHFPAVNAAYALDGQHQLTVPLVVAPPLGSANDGAGVRSRSDDHLSVDLDCLDNLERNELANFCVRGTQSFSQSQFNVKSVTTGLRGCYQCSIFVLVASSGLRKRNARRC